MNIMIDLQEQELLSANAIADSSQETLSTIIKKHDKHNNIAGHLFSVCTALQGKKYKGKLPLTITGLDDLKIDDCVTTTLAHECYGIYVGASISLNTRRISTAVELIDIEECANDNGDIQMANVKAEHIRQSLHT